MLLIFKAEKSPQIFWKKVYWKPFLNWEENLVIIFEKNRNKWQEVFLELASLWRIVVEPVLRKVAGNICFCFSVLVCHLCLNSERYTWPRILFSGTCFFISFLHIVFYVCLIQGCTATTRHQVTMKKSGIRE